MLLEELKKKIKSADDSNLEDVDSVCVSWLLDAADDGLRGDEGKTAQKLLEIVKELLDIKDDIWSVPPMVEHWTFTEAER